MTYHKALKIAEKHCREVLGWDAKALASLNTKRQVRKFANGFGRVRMYAGMLHTRVAMVPR